MFCQKTLHETVIHEQARCCDEAANHQLPIAEVFLNQLNSFHRGMFKLNEKFDADSLFYSLSHFECDSHTVLILTQQHLPPPLTSTVKSSFFMHIHSSPLSLAARLHQCHANHSHYINNGCIFLDRPHILVMGLEPLFPLLGMLFLSF